MSKLIGKPIEELLGSKIKTVDAWVNFSSFGLPVIHLSNIILEDGREFHVDGEHDNAYLPLESRKMTLENLIPGCVDGPDEAERLKKYWKESV